MLDFEPLLDLSTRSIPEALQPYYWDWDENSENAPEEPRDIAVRLLPYAIAINAHRVVEGVLDWTGVDSISHFTPQGVQGACAGVNRDDLFIPDHPLYSDTIEYQSEEYEEAEHQYMLAYAEARTYCERCPIKNECAIEGVRLSMVNYLTIRRDILMDLIADEDRKAEEDPSYVRVHTRTLQSRANEETRYIPFQGVFGGLNFWERETLFVELEKLLKDFYNGLLSRSLGTHPDSPAWDGMSPIELNKWASLAREVRSGRYVA